MILFSTMISAIGLSVAISAGVSAHAKASEEPALNCEGFLSSLSSSQIERMNDLAARLQNGLLNDKPGTQEIIQNSIQERVPLLAIEKNGTSFTVGFPLDLMMGESAEDLDMIVSTSSGAEVLVKQALLRKLTAIWNLNYPQSLREAALRKIAAVHIVKFASNSKFSKIQKLFQAARSNRLEISFQLSPSRTLIGSLVEMIATNDARLILVLQTQNEQSGTDESGSLKVIEITTDDSQTMLFVPWVDLDQTQGSIHLDEVEIQLIDSPTSTINSPAASFDQLAGQFARRRTLGPDFFDGSVPQD